MLLPLPTRPVLQSAATPLPLMSSASGREAPRYSPLSAVALSLSRGLRGCVVCRCMGAHEACNFLCAMRCAPLPLSSGLRMRCSMGSSEGTAEECVVQVHGGP